MANESPSTYLNKTNIDIEIAALTKKADLIVAPNLQDIKLEAKKVVITKPIIGKIIAYKISTIAVTKTSMIFPNSAHSGFGSGLKIKNKDEVNKKKAIMYGNIFGPTGSWIKLSSIIKAE